MNDRQKIADRYYQELCDIARCGKYKYSQIFRKVTDYLVSEGFDKKMVKSIEDNQFTSLENLSKRGILPQVFSTLIKKNNDPSPAIF